MCCIASNGSPWTGDPQFEEEEFRPPVRGYWRSAADDQCHVQPAFAERMPGREARNRYCRICGGDRRDSQRDRLRSASRPARRPTRRKRRLFEPLQAAPFSEAARAALRETRGGVRRFMSSAMAARLDRIDKGVNTAVELLAATIELRRQWSGNFWVGIETPFSLWGPRAGQFVTLVCRVLQTLPVRQ